MKGKGTGRIVHESDAEAAQTDQLANQMEAALSIVYAQGKKIKNCQISDEAGWTRRNVVIRFEDGTGLLISGEDVTVKELAIDEVPGFEEWPDRAEMTGKEVLPPASSPPPLPRGDE